MLTLIVDGAPPEGVAVIVPVYVPMLTPVGTAWMVRVAGVVLLLVAILSQFPPDWVAWVSVNATGPAAFVTFATAVPGVTPTGTGMITEAGLTPNGSETAPMTKVTGILTELDPDVTESMAS
jgi:hypothetical protein